MEQTVWKTRSLKIINQVAADPHFRVEAGDPPEKEQRIQAYRQANIGSALLVPLTLQQELIAVLGLHRCGQGHTWKADEIQLATMVAEQATLAISQAQAYEQVRALAQREFLINTITTAIRSSLDPQVIK